MRVFFALVLASSAAGCTVSFDPDGQPCDAQGHCLAGYVCQLNVCHAGSSGSTAASSSTGTHGSTSGTTGTASSSTGGTTGAAATCTGVICPVAEECKVSTDGANCVARAATSGTPGTCSANADCTNGVCLQGPAGLPGICIESCDAGCPSATACDALIGSRGNSFWGCLDTPLPTPCTGTSKGECASANGTSLACLPFSAPPSGTTLVDELPVLFCDTPLVSGAASGATCTASSGCASGVCASSGGGGGVCLNLCLSSADCGASQACEAVFNQGSSSTVLGCGPLAATGCGVCSSCGPDAPDCLTSVTGESFCGLTCSDSGGSPCGVGRACVASTFDDQTYCAVSGATCP